MSHVDAHAMAQAIQQWEDVEQDSQAIEILEVLDELLPILPC